MQYFIDHIQVYASVNQKGLALQKFVLQYKHMLVADYNTLCHLRDTIKAKIDELNKAYPRTIPLSFDETGGQWTVYPKENSEKTVLYLQYEKVRGIYSTPCNARGDVS